MWASSKVSKGLATFKGVGIDLVYILLDADAPCK